MMSININGIINYEIIKKAYTSELFYNYLENLIKTNRITGMIFLMDNVSFHRNKRIRDLIEETNNELLFIPPYSPEYNPIEMVFGNLKSELRNNIKSQICERFDRYLPIYIKKINKTDFIKKLYKKSFIKNI